MGGKELANWEENHKAQMAGIIDHRPRNNKWASKKASGPKGAQRKK